MGLSERWAEVSDLITVDAQSLVIVVEQLMIYSGCGGENYEQDCEQCKAIKVCQEAINSLSDVEESQS